MAEFAASVIAIIQVTAEVGKRLTQYGIAVKNAVKDIESIHGRLESLERVLQKLNDLAKRVEKSSLPIERWPTLISLNATGGPIEITRGHLLLLRGKLLPVEGTARIIAERLKWPKKKKRMEEDLEMIEEQKRVFMEFLNVEHIAQSVDTGLAVSKLEQSDIDSRLNKIVRWLSSTDPSTNHTAARKKHEDQTGKWFTQGKEYQIWKEGFNSFLWLHGIPGSGKTILCSEIIEQTLKYCESRPAFHLAYFYFSFQDTDKQKITIFLRSILSQLVLRIGSLPDAVQFLYESYKFSQPPIDRLLSVIHALIDLPAVTEVFLIIDALDECPNGKAERDNLCDILEADLINSLAPLTTSPPISIKDYVVRSDIRKFVKTSLAESRLKEWPADVQGDIEKTLIDGAHGMFRWVDCQLVALTKCLTRNDIKKALKSLPKTLDETYERIRTSVDEEHRPMLATALKWISVAKRPLTVKEIAEATVIHPEEKPPFHEHNRLPDPNWIIPILSSLVVISTYNPRYERHRRYIEDPAVIVSLAHFSVEEYLTSARILSGPAAMFHMAGLAAEEACVKGSLLYLNSFSVSENKTTSYSDLIEFPLLKYASQFWFLHALAFQDSYSSEINELILDFLLSKNTRETWLWIHNFDFQEHIFYIGPETFHPPKAPLYLAASLGLTKALETLVSQGMELNAKGGLWGTALQGAAFYKQERSVELLLDAGADVGDALGIASARGTTDIVRRLLDTGIDVNMEGPSFGHNPLHRACIAGNVETVKILVDAGAKVNHIALAMAYFTLERFEKKVVYGSVEEFEVPSALENAACSCNIELVKLLLEAGLNVDIRGPGRITALEAVVEPILASTGEQYVKETQERRVMAKFLLNAGADEGLLSEGNRAKLKDLLDDELCYRWLEEHYRPLVERIFFPL